MGVAATGRCRPKAVNLVTADQMTRTLIAAARSATVHGSELVSHPRTSRKPTKVVANAVLIQDSRVRSSALSDGGGAPAGLMNRRY